jgi:putative endonuclease
MTRFIPADVLERTLQKEKFIIFLINENRALLEKVEKIITS